MHTSYLATLSTLLFLAAAAPRGMTRPGLPGPAPTTSDRRVDTRLPPASTSTTDRAQINTPSLPGPTQSYSSLTYTETSSPPDPTTGAECSVPTTYELAGWTLFEDYQPGTPGKYWSFDQQTGLTQNRMETGYASWEPAGDKPHVWRVQPDLKYTVRGDVVATATVPLCLNPGREFRIQMDAGMVERLESPGARLSVRIGSKYLIQDKPVCSDPSECRDDGYLFREEDGSRILMGYFYGSAVIDGTYNPDNSYGRLQDLVLEVSYEDTKPKGGNHFASYFSQIWVFRNF